MPRVVLAALVGGMLSLAGATYQGVFRNPLVDPYLLGVAAGAGLGATLAIAYLPEGLRGQRALPAAAFVGGAVAVFLTYSVGRSTGRERDATTLVLAGVTVASFFTALQTFVQQQNADTLQQVYTWILGSIPSSGWSDVVLVLPYVAIATAVDPRVPEGRGRPEPRRRGGHEPRRRRPPRTARSRRRGDGRHGRRRRRLRAHRLRRDHRSACDPDAHGRGLSGAAPAVRDRRRRASSCSRTSSPELRFRLAEIPIGIVTAFFGAPFFALVLRSSRGGTA